MTSTRSPTPPHQLSDDELLRLARENDPCALSELYRRYEREARRFARSLVNANDVDDVVAESFTKMLRAMSGGRGPVDHPARYLMVTVRTTAATFHARHAKRARTTQRIIDEIATTSGKFELADGDLEEAFRSLPVRWRKVIWWTEIDGCTPTEVGERLDLSPAAASALAYRARRGLRTAYIEARLKPEA